MSSLPSPQELRMLRKKAGLTQKELARRAGVSQSLIARIERGTVDPRLSTLRKIVRVLEEALKEKTSARHVMKTPVITLKEEDTIKKAAELIWEHGISQIPVVNSSGRVIGTVYEDTIVRLLLQRNIEPSLLNLKISEVMDPPLPCVSPNKSLDEVIKMLLSGFPAVLVVEKGRPIGIITKSDIIAVQLLKRRIPPETSGGS